MNSHGKRTEHEVARSPSTEEHGETAASRSGDTSRQPPAASRWYWPAGIALLLLLVVSGAFATRDAWFPHVRSLLSEHGHPENGALTSADDHEDHGHSDHEEEENSHPGHDEAASVELSLEGRKNVGLELVTVELRDFDRTISIPGTVVERAGRSAITVSAPMTGIVTRIYPIQGEAVTPGQRLFDLRLTHEDLVEKQSALLSDLQQLDVVKQEVARLQEVTRSGAIAGKTLLEREYEQQKLEAAINADMQALELHGLTAAQVGSIVNQRQLLSTVEIVAPGVADLHEQADHEDYLQFKEVLVKQGDHVSAGTALAVLTDHCKLYIEGQAFEHDAALLNRIANEGVDVSAVVNENDADVEYESGLKVLYVENQVDVNSRALQFYVVLPNQLVRNETTPDGHRFIGWRFRPGQRVDLRIPVETWKNRIVLPVEAVVRDGAESYVFQENKGHFDRTAVHVVHRDQRWAVIQPEETLNPGDQVAGKGAYQIHLAIKNKSGAPIDPHAGHGH